MLTRTLIAPPNKQNYSQSESYFFYLKLPKLLQQFFFSQYFEKTTAREGEISNERYDQKINAYAYYPETF